MTTTLMTRRLQLLFQVGTNAAGQPKLKSHYFAHVSPTAVDADVLAVGQALGALFSDPLYQVAIVDQSALS